MADAVSIKPSPGIYAFFFDGAKFPLDINLKNTDIIYIGKTESSGISRVLNTHFGTGQTGSSTVRRSLSGLFLSQLGLVPILRSASDKEKGHYTFKLDSNSENTLTKWMIENLKVSFYPIPNIEDVKTTEYELIRMLKPILNLESNPLNPFRDSISQLRRQCAEIAFGERAIPSATILAVTEQSSKKREATRSAVVQSPRRKTTRTGKQKSKRKGSARPIVAERTGFRWYPLIVPFLFFLLVLYALVKMYM